MQSLNEELETSKEELESTNEELTTVNEEMVSRNADLNRLNNDLTNLQISTKLVILLLGRDLTIRRFSAEAEKQFHLLASDVGRRLGSIRHNLQLPDLEAIVAKVVGSGREWAREVQDKDGHWYLLRVRPYVAADQQVDGAVLVLVDVNATKEAEQEVSNARDFAEAIIGTARDPLLILDAGLRVRKVNAAYATIFKTSAPALIGRSVFEIGRGCWALPKLRRLLHDILPRRSFFEDFEVTQNFTTVGSRTIVLNARMLKQGATHREKILLGFQDITERARVEDALRVAETLLSRHAGQLEGQVTARTAELLAANRRLEVSVDSVSQGQERYRVLLEESQLMQGKLRQLTHQVLTAQEEERKQISRELHDEVVQLLVGINVELAALGRGVRRGCGRIPDGENRPHPAAGGKLCPRRAPFCPWPAAGGARRPGPDPGTPRVLQEPRGREKNQDQPDGLSRRGDVGRDQADDAVSRRAGSPDQCRPPRARLGSHAPPQQIRRRHPNGDQRQWPIIPREKNPAGGQQQAPRSRGHARTRGDGGRNPDDRICARHTARPCARKSPLTLEKIKK